MGGALVATGTLLLVVVCAWNMKKCVRFRIGAPCRGRKMLVNYEILMLQWTDGHVLGCFLFSIRRTMLICLGVIIRSRTFWRMKLFFERLSLTRNGCPQGSTFHSFVSSKCVTRSVCHGVSRELSVNEPSSANSWLELDTQFFYFSPDSDSYGGSYFQKGGRATNHFWRIGRGTRVPLQGAEDVVPLLCHRRVPL